MERTFAHMVFCFSDHQRNRLNATFFDVSQSTKMQNALRKKVNKCLVLILTFNFLFSCSFIYYKYSAVIQRWVLLRINKTLYFKYIELWTGHVGWENQIVFINGLQNVYSLQLDIRFFYTLGADDLKGEAWWTAVIELFKQHYEMDDNTTTFETGENSKILL